MPVRGSLGAASRDVREWVRTGLVVEVDRDGDAPIVVVELTGGGRVEARPWYPGAADGRGCFYRHPIGAEVVVLLDHGLPGGALALLGPSGASQAPPEDADEDGLYLYDDVVEVRSVGGQTVDGVVLRPLLDDLRDVLGDLLSVMAALTSTLTPPGTAPQNAALLTGMRTAASTIVGKLTTITSRLDTSRTGQGTGPYCSPVLRATDGG